MKNLVEQIQTATVVDTQEQALEVLHELLKQKIKKSHTGTGRKMGDVREEATKEGKSHLPSA